MIIINGIYILTGNYSLHSYFCHVPIPIRGISWIKYNTLHSLLSIYRVLLFSSVLLFRYNIAALCLAILEEIILELSVFKRALRCEDKVAFDSLMNKARAHASSCTVTPMLEPMDAVFLSILVEQEKEINSLKGALNAENRVT